MEILPAQSPPAGLSAHILELIRKAGNAEDDVHRLEFLQRLGDSRRPRAQDLGTGPAGRARFIEMNVFLSAKLRTANSLLPAERKKHLEALPHSPHNGAGIGLLFPGL
jgi:hypothetical protein